MAAIRQDGPEAAPALGHALAHILPRLRLTRWCLLAARGTLVAACFSLLAVSLARVGLLPESLPLGPVILGFFFLGAGFGTLLAFRKPLDAMAAARQVEARLGLKERLSSALEFERSGPVFHDPEAALLLRLQQEDAAAHAAALRPEDAVPFSLPWEAKALFPVLLLLMLVFVLPMLTVFVPPAVRSERAIVRASGEEITRSARVIEKRADEQGLPATKHAAQDLRKLGEKIAQGRMDKKQAMVQMSQADRRMADAQRRGAQTDPEGKNLADAGRQLAQSLKPTAADQTRGGKGNRGGAPAKPGLNGHEPPSNSDQKQDDTTNRAMQQVAQSLKQGSASGLIRQLQDMARRITTQPMPPARQQQTAQELKKISEALKGSPLSEAQKHVQSAADAMKRGEAQGAAAELNKAADAADRQARQQRDAEGLQETRQSLQNSEQKMAQASKPADITHSAPGQSPAMTPSDSSAQQKPGADTATGGRPNGTPGGAAQRGTGTPQGEAPGRGGSGSPPSRLWPPHPAPPSGQTVPSSGGGVGVQRGMAHPLDPKFNPKNNPNYGKIYLGAGHGGSGGKLLKAEPGVRPTSGRPLISSVPYSGMLTPARKGAETAMDQENIPPAYRSGVRRYFASLQPLK